MTPLESRLAELMRTALPKQYINADLYRAGLDALEEAVKALKYIQEYSWADEKPKWGNEFVEVASLALASIEKKVCG